MEKLHFDIEPAKDGAQTLAVYPGGKRVYLHSRVNPLKEGEMVTDLPDPAKYDLLVVLGCGLGYSLTGIKENLSRFRVVVIVDILEGIEKKISGNSHTSFLTESGNVKFFTGIDPDYLEELLSGAINLDQVSGIRVIEHNQSFRIFQSYYQQVKSLIRKIIDKKAGDIATINAFGNLFLRNALNNLKNLKSCSPVSSLEGKFRGRRAIIVSSAPSVEASVKELAFYQDDIYIIAVDSALPVLRCFGIKPDFVISIDPQPRIGEHFLEHDPSGICHVFSIVSPPELPARYGGFISLNSHPVSQVIDDMFPGVIGSVDSSTGSVAGDAFLFAFMAGFEYIAMTGFDFSFTRNVIYARETAYQKRYSKYFNNRFRTAESFNAEYIFRSSGSLIVDGKYTRRSFIGYRDSLNSLTGARGFHNIYMINRKGLELSNAEDTDFHSFIGISEKGDENKKINLDKLKYQTCADSLDIDSIRKKISGERILNEIVRESLGGEVNSRRIKRIALLVN